MARNTTPKIGDKVVVPWGLDEIVGVVLEVYGPSTRKSVLVRVPTMGRAGETLDASNISFPSRAVRAVATA